MMYSEIVSYPRPWNKERFPSVANVFIPAEQFRAFEQLIEDQTQTAMLGHDIAEDDLVLIYVGCTSDEVKDKLEARWG